jgi:hypothetical protein
MDKNFLVDLFLGFHFDFLILGPKKNFFKDPGAQRSTYNPGVYLIYRSTEKYTAPLKKSISKIPVKDIKMFKAAP